jgi:O-antigen/teichoic acid export membrane protein
VSRFKSSIPLLALAYGLAAGANFLLSVLVGRRLGAAALGNFALAVALSRIFYAATDLGVSAHLTRAISRDRSLAQPYTSLFTGFRLSLIPIAVVLVTTVGLSRGETFTFGPIAIALGCVSLQSLFESVLLAHDRQTETASLTIFTSALVATGSMGWFFAGDSLLEFSFVYAAVSFGSIAAWAYWTGRRVAVWPRPKLDGKALAAQLRRSWPIGVSNLLGLSALRAPILVLGWFGTSADVGTFSAIDMFVTAAAILQTAVSNATYPKLAASYRKDPDRYRRLFWGSNLALAAVGVLTAIFLMLFGAPIISIVFASKGFRATAALVRVIAWSAPCLLLVHHNIVIFAAADHERSNVRLMIGWFAVIATFQLALVPTHGLTGAAWGVLLGRLVGLGVLGAAIAASGIHRGGRDRT